ncbi:MAG TPA: hypothetical protein PLD52_10020 [Bacteroidales bacterium]|nr:hypothetical protein [Bacteroidales bacterium]
MKEFIWNFIRGFRLGPVMLFIHPQSALTKRGWWRSFHKKLVVDKNNLPIPWWTYPFIDFLIPRLSGEFCVLEFGSGSSTIWLSRFVKQVISVEDHEEWAKKIEKKTQLSKINFQHNNQY